MPDACHGAMPTSAQSTVRILLVEDEPKLRRSLAEGLGLENWHVTSAASGQEAQRELNSQPFDLIVLDWMLPDCDGLEVVRRLRAQGSTVPILMITARGGANAEAVAKESGATGYLAKPFSFDDLLAHARTLLNRPA